MSLTESKTDAALPTDERDEETRIAGLHSAQDSVNVQERKIRVIARALADMGMGKYQWAIFLLCGFGYTLDLLWAQAFGLITPRIQQELNVSPKNYGDIFSVFSAGLTVGAFTWGILVDQIGRKWAFNLTCLITSLFGVVFGAPSTWGGLCTITFFIGFGLGGNIPIDAAIVMEFVPSNRRFLLVTLSVFQPIGSLLTSLISWALIPSHSCITNLPSCRAPSSLSAGLSPPDCCGKSNNYGWRYTTYTLGAISMVAFIGRVFIFTFRESPRWLITKGRDEEAVEVIRKIAAYNGVETSLQIEDLRACEDAESFTGEEAAHDERGMPTPSPTRLEKVAEKKSEWKQFVDMRHLKGLFDTPYVARVTLLVWIAYICDFWGFTIAGAFLPKILADRGAAADGSTYTTYRNYIIISCSGIPGVLLGALLVEVPILGRKWSMVITSALMATSLFLYSTITTVAASVGFNAMEYFFQSTYTAILYGYTPEIFPSHIRGTASGLASFWGRLTSIVAPLIAARLEGQTGVLYLAGGGVFICTLASLFMPETRGGGAA